MNTSWKLKALIWLVVGAAVLMPICLISVDSHVVLADPGGDPGGP